MNNTSRSAKDEGQELGRPGSHDHCRGESHLQVRISLVAKHSTAGSRPSPVLCPSAPGRGHGPGASEGICSTTQARKCFPPRAQIMALFSAAETQPLDS